MPKTHAELLDEQAELIREYRHMEQIIAQAPEARGARTIREHLAREIAAIDAVLFEHEVAVIEEGAGLF